MQIDIAQTPASGLSPNNPAPVCAVQTQLIGHDFGLPGDGIAGHSEMASLIETDPFCRPHFQGRHETHRRSAVTLRQPFARR